MKVEFLNVLWDESELFNEVNAMMKRAHLKGVNAIEYVRANGSNFYTLPLTPEDEASIYMERFTGALETGDTTTKFKAALLSRNCGFKEGQVSPFRFASRSYSEYLKWGN